MVLVRRVRALLISSFIYHAPRPQTHPSAPPPSLCSKMDSDDIETLRQINDNIDTQLKQAEEDLSKATKPSILRTEQKLIVAESPDYESTSPPHLHPSPSPAIGTKATIRLQKAKIEALTNQVKAGVQANQDLQTQVEDLTARLAEATANKKKTSHKTKTNASSTNNDEVTKLRSELRSVKAELVSCRQSLEGERRSRQVKLEKALQEVNKYKRFANRGGKSETASRGATLSNTSSSNRSRFDTKERDALLGKVKKMERQQHDFMVALKHQQKLVDALKRLKVHTEAAKVLTFKEEAFVKEIGWGSNT